MDSHSFIEFLKLTEKLKTITRHSWTSDKNRMESVAEHSWMVSLLAFLAIDNLKKQKFDKLKVLKMAIIHNIGESLTGDIPTHDQKEGFHKLETEKAAIELITSKLPSTTGKELMSLWAEFEKQETLESKIVEAIDKLEVGFQHNMADLSTWDENDKNYRRN
ncbi:MAG: HD domain-containing protein [Candidatus Dojkabacteria bacterium]|nr:HD domain-containing protein [Candidatus Dojkabacteria bacterium]